MRLCMKLLETLFGCEALFIEYLGLYRELMLLAVLKQVLCKELISDYIIHDNIFACIYFRSMY